MPRLAATVLVALLAGCGSEPRAEPPDVVQHLREGTSVLVMRHALTESTTPPSESLRSCAAQRNLSEAGRRQARAIGAAIRTLEIPIGEVRASPMCRTRETAELAFGRATPDRRLISPGVVGTIEGDDRRARILRNLVRTIPVGGENLVLVTHTGNIGALDESVVEGELLVYWHGRLVERITPDELAALARRG